jgi:crotonobetainyl-CoA:carnitine CoA-transferase CaiB-like acyl-CoA transferase
MSLQPLTCERVLDFTAFPPGALCTVMLADLGAEIIRVEPPALKGKPSSVFGQIALSRGKRSMTLDMRSTEAIDILNRLVPSMTIVIENARPGAMEGRGFGYRQAREINPGIIWCSISGFGQDGPNALHAGHDISYLAHSGLLAALTDDREFMPQTPLSLPLAALAAVVGIQGALAQRAKTGHGAFVDISLSEVALWALGSGTDPLSDRPPKLPASADRRLYACSDGRHVAVASAEPRTWGALCDGLDLPELQGRLHDPLHDAASTDSISQKFLTRPAAEWVQRLTPLGAAATMVNHAHEVLADPHVMARGSIGYIGSQAYPRSPVRLIGADGDQSEAVAKPASTVGADTHDILLGAGFSEDELERLAQQQMI